MRNIVDHGSGDPLGADSDEETAERSNQNHQYSRYKRPGCSGTRKESRMSFEGRFDMLHGP
jgi:hypothetical protein